VLKVPFYRASIGQAELDATAEVLRSGWLTTGPKTKEFERNFSAYIGQPHAVALNSCTAALHLALEAIGLQPDEAVLVPTMTFAATAEVVRYFNARPLLVDCRTSDFNMDIAHAEKVMRKAQADGIRVRAIIPVHFGGQMGDVAGVIDLAQRYGLRVIEDAAHCCPAFWRENAGAPWRPVGSDADISCFSFYANKTITTGEGGMACTADTALADRMRIMSLHGISRDAWKRFTAEGSWYYEIVAPGFKYNMTDVASAVGVEQLRRADDLHQRRTIAAATYARLLEDQLDRLVLPTQLPNRIHSWHLYVIRLRLERLTIGRDAVIELLKAAGIGTSVHWMPLHMHPYYRELYGYERTEFPVAGALFNEIISLPLFPDMTSDDIQLVADTLTEILDTHRAPTIGEPAV
jgi:dTDP-4-amino-4,6-dideoxygalactose transaminase